MREIKIEPLKQTDMDTASDLLCKAFINTPFTGAIMGGKSEKHMRMLKMGFRSMLDKKPGEKIVARDGDRIVGVMRMVKWPKCQDSIPKGLEKLPMILFARKTAAKFFEARRVWGEHDPKEPHWHVDPIGVLPEYQGKGVGSRLMDYYCRKVDSENMPAYHETDQPQNVRFYEKFGYKVIKKEPNLGITNWYLWREPNRAT